MAPRHVSLLLVVLLLVTSCGSIIDEATGPVSADTVTQLEDLLHRRAAAIVKGDRPAFLQTIDTTRAAFRAIQLEDFDLPTGRGALGSSFKITGVERYGTYVRGWVEEILAGNSFAGSYGSGVAYFRRYFRRENGSWLLTEPTAAESGLEKEEKSGDLSIVSWGLDDDVAETLVAASDEAWRFALSKSPTGQRLSWAIAFPPTSEIAGANAKGYHIFGGNALRYFLYPGYLGFDVSRRGVSDLTRVFIREMSLYRMRDAVAPGVGARLGFDAWLNDGWADREAGHDNSVLLKQACVGVPIPTLKALSAGAPDPLTPQIAAEAFGRYYAYSSSLVDYLYEQYGKDAYWKLMTAFMQDASSAVTFPKVLGVTPDVYYTSWLVWLKKKYC